MTWRQRSTVAYASLGVFAGLAAILNDKIALGIGLTGIGVGGIVGIVLSKKNPPPK